MCNIFGQTYAMARNGTKLQGKCRVKKHDMIASLHRKVGSHHPSFASAVRFVSCGVMTRPDRFQDVGALTSDATMA